MLDFSATIMTNLFRTYVIKKFILTFFQSDVDNKKKEKLIYSVFFLITSIIHLIFHFPPLNIITNVIMIFIITQVYSGEQKKKILVTMLIYGINMICDVLSVYMFSNYVVGGGYSEISAYITVLLISLCEFIIERFIIKKRQLDFTPPHWKILIVIPIISIGILSILFMSNGKRRIILVFVSIGILIINMLIFYLYDALLDTYLKQEENTLFERQIASYANQLDVLMQSEEKINALRHDMKHHLNELFMMATSLNKINNAAQNEGTQEIKKYIQNMQTFIENDKEISKCGNKDVDSILNYMIHKAESLLTKVEYKICIPKDLDIHLFDLNIIFGNLLDNAITASNKSKDKWLSVTVRYEKGMLFIQIMNSYDGLVKKQGLEYISTKRDVEIHGIGLQNVKKVIMNYHGRMEISDRNNVFDVKIMLYTSIIK